MLSNFIIPEPNGHFSSLNSQIVGPGEPPNDKGGGAPEQGNTPTLEYQFLISAKTSKSKTRKTLHCAKEGKGKGKDRIQGYR